MVTIRETDLAAVTAQQERVEGLTRRLQQAEQTVSRAGTAEASAAAHRRADALLLELEEAEHHLHTLMRSPAAPPAPVRKRRRPQQTAEPGQECLFDVS